MEIKAEEIVAAYKETGIKPVQRNFGGELCGCAITALAYHKGYSRESEHITVISFLASLGYSMQHIWDFVYGFDGVSCFFGNQETYAEGLKAWELVKEAGLV